MLSLISYAVFSENTDVLLDEEKADKIYNLSVKYDLAQIVSFALESKGLLEKTGLSEKFKRAEFIAINRRERLSYEEKVVSDLFEREGIDFILLKGASYCELYPKRYFRTGCDVDVLVKEADVIRAKDALIKKGYKFINYGRHDMSLTAPSGVVMELHFATVEKGRANRAYEQLVNIWNKAHPVTAHKYALDGDMQYFYHIAHMAKHFEAGGTGVRPFIDLILLRQKTDCTGADEMLEKAGLKKFESVLLNLAEAWFFGGAKSELSEKTEDFILAGGKYGSLKQGVAIQNAKRGGKIRYILRRMFLPYSEMKNYFPVLKKHKWLLPFCYPVRWIKALFGGRRKKAMKEFLAVKNVDKQSTKKAVELLDELGLNEK